MQSKCCSSHCRAISTKIAHALILCIALFLLGATAHADVLQDKINRTNEILASPNTQSTTQIEEGVAGSAWQMIQGLGFCLGFFLIGVWVYKKVMLKNIPVGTGKKITLLERQALSPRAALYLATVDSEQVLVGLNGDSIALLVLKQGTLDPSVVEAIEREYGK